MEFLHRAWAEIDLGALIHNFNLIKEKVAGCHVMAVVKANAYGHSVCDIAPVLQQQGTGAFAVSNLTEALELRQCGIVKPVLILGYTPAEAASVLAENGISQCVYSEEYALALSAEAVKNGVTVGVHIKLDTGMGRLGFDCRDASLPEIDAAVSAARLPGFRFEGIFTHFAVSDRDASSEDGFTDLQYGRFLAAKARFCDAGLTPTMTHCCNSAALWLDGDKHADFCRAGIMLYGLSPLSECDAADFRPVMTMKSVVSMVKTIRPGETVSYGRTFRADRPMRVATVSAGYADGYPRLLSGRGSVLIRGRRAPVIGRVCMDQLLVDVSEIGDVRQGDEVVLFGQGLPAGELAALCDTIHYEIVCGVSARVPRVVIRPDETERK